MQSNPYVYNPPNNKTYNPITYVINAKQSSCSKVDSAIVIKNKSRFYNRTNGNGNVTYLVDQSKIIKLHGIQ